MKIVQAVALKGLVRRWTYVYRIGAGKVGYRI